MHRGHGIAVGVFLGVLSQLRVDGVLPRRNGILSHLLAEFPQVIVNFLNHYFRVFTTEKEIKQLTKILSAMCDNCPEVSKLTWMFPSREHSILCASCRDP